LVANALGIDQDHLHHSIRTVWLKATSRSQVSQRRRRRWTLRLPRTLQWLERAYVQHDAGLTFVKTDPLFKRIRRDTRYAALLKKLKLD
jgi:hypothetical protein